MRELLFYDGERVTEYETLRWAREALRERLHRAEGLAYIVAGYKGLRYVLYSGYPEDWDGTAADLARVRHWHED